MKLVRLVSILLAFGLSACQAAVTEPEGDADTSGVVLEFLPVQLTGGPRFLLETPGASAPADTSIVRVTTETAILVRGPAGQLRSGQLGDIRVGDRVHVRTTGIEIRTRPRQVYATRIEVIR